MYVETLLKGIAAGLLIAAPVGPVGVLCVHRTLACGQAGAPPAPFEGRAGGAGRRQDPRAVRHDDRGVGPDVHQQERAAALHRVRRHEVRGGVGPVSPETKAMGDAAARTLAIALVARGLLAPRGVGGHGPGNESVGAGPGGTDGYAASGGAGELPLQTSHLLFPSRTLQ